MCLSSSAAEPHVKFQSNVNIQVGNDEENRYTKYLNIIGSDVPAEWVESLYCVDRNRKLLSGVSSEWRQVLG